MRLGPFPVTYRCTPRALAGASAGPDEPPLSRALAIAVLAGVPHLLADAPREEGLRVITAGDRVSPREVDIAMVEVALATREK